MFSPSLCCLCILVTVSLPCRGIFPSQGPVYWWLALFPEEIESQKKSWVCLCCEGFSLDFLLSFLSLTFYLRHSYFLSLCLAGPLAFGQASIPSVQQYISSPIPNSIAVTCSPFWKQLQMDPRTKWQWNAILLFSLSITHFSYCHLLKTFSLLKWVFLVSLEKNQVDVAVWFFLIIMIFVSFF